MAVSHKQMRKAARIGGQEHITTLLEACDIDEDILLDFVVEAGRAFANVREEGTSDADHSTFCFMAGMVTALNLHRNGELADA